MYEFCPWYQSFTLRLQRKIAALKPTLRMSMLATLTAASLGVSAERVHASPTCQRLIRAYTEKLVPNKVSKATAARWKIWNRAHPDFHPSARPRFILTKEETTKRMDIACEVELARVSIDNFVLPVGEGPFESLERADALPGVSAFQGPPNLLIASSGSAPSLFAPLYPPISGGGGQSPPFVVAPIIPGPPIDVAPVPEPSSFALLGTGMLFFYVLSRRSSAARAGRKVFA